MANVQQPKPPIFYPLVDDTSTLATLAHLGYRWIQWRNKASDAKLLKQVYGLHRQNRLHVEQKLILNDDPQAAYDYGFDGVHLGQEDLTSQAANLNQLRVKLPIFGVSTHDLAELEIALGHAPDYLAIGPIYPSTTKPHLKVRTIESTRALVEYAKPMGMPLVAIGGITQANAAATLMLGFSTLAFAHWVDAIVELRLTEEQLVATIGG